jgi:hypothetical protein
MGRDHLYRRNVAAAKKIKQITHPPAGMHRLRHKQSPPITTASGSGLLCPASLS